MLLIQYFLDIVPCRSLQERHWAEFLHPLESNTCHEPSSQKPSEIKSLRIFNPGISNPPVREKAEILGSWHSVSSSHTALGQVLLKCWTVWQPAGAEAELHIEQFVIYKSNGTQPTVLKHTWNYVWNISRLVANYFLSNSKIKNLPSLLGGKQSGANCKHQGYEYFRHVSCQTHLVFRPETSSYGWSLTVVDLC